jgi:putative acetyltransferase
MIEIRPCATAEDFSAAIALTRDYIRWLDIDLSFQEIESELANFSVVYGPPQGLFLLAWHQGQLAGGVGLRPLGERVCEMKRLYVYDAFKSLGAGRRLCSALIQAATGLGYERMRLDTLERMEAAIRLYASLGFRQIAPYRFNPDPTTRYMELRLG